MSPRASCGLIGRRRTVFVEGAQGLFEVDEVTAYICQELSASLSVAELVAKLMAEGMSRTAARGFVRQFLHFWSRRELLEVEITEKAKLCSEVIDLGGRPIRIACADTALMKLVRPMLPLGGETNSFADVSYTLMPLGDDICIAAPDKRALLVRRREAVPSLKGLLTDGLIANLEAATAFHGTLLGNASGVLLLCGSPGAGKTTLALAMKQRGFAIFADDIVLLHDDGIIRGVPFASAMKSSSRKLFPGEVETLDDYPQHIRLDRQTVRYIPTNSPRMSFERVKTIVLLNRTARAAAETLLVDPLAALGHLIAEANNPQNRLSRRQFDNLLRVVMGAQTLELKYSDLEKGAKALADIHNAG